MIQKEAIPAGNEWIDKSVREFGGNPFVRIDKDWMLITAGNAIPCDSKTACDKAAGCVKRKSNWNTMTASWGGLGVLWSRDVAFIFIRPSRCTYDFANNGSIFTLSFFDETYRSALKLCGEKSGRDIDKAEAAGLTPIFFTADDSIEGAVSFKEAKEIIFCRKIYFQDLDPAHFLDPSIEKNYKGSDYHRLYIGEVIGFKSR